MYAATVVRRLAARRERYKRRAYEALASNTLSPRNARRILRKVAK